MMTVLLWHVDEHVVELLERVVVSIAAEDGRHLLFSFTLSLISTNVHTLQTRSIIDEQIGELRRHFIIHHPVHHANIVVGEEVNSTILSLHRHHIRIGLLFSSENVQRHTDQTVGFQLR